MLDPDFLRTGAKASVYVTQLAILVALAAWLGKKLDIHFGTEPWLILLCTTIGFALGLLALARGLNEQQHDQSLSHSDDDPPAGDDP